MSARPPRFAVLLMHVLLPHALRDVICGDLEEEWNASLHPSRLRFWNLALRSIVACGIDRLRRDAYRRATNNPPRRGDSAVQSLLQDVRYGCRLMWRSPGFTLAAVATLALGIGANSAIFGMLNVLSLKPLPYHDPARVAFVLGWDVDEGEMRFNLRQADFVDLQRQARSLESLAAYWYLSANLTDGDMPERVQAYRITPNTFSLLGVSAALGRVFADGDQEADVAVISHGLWQRRFGGDPSIVGRRLVVNGQPHVIVGVMPQRFEFPVFNFKGDMWMPGHLRDSARGQAAATDGAMVIGRLRAGVSYRQAQSELDVLMQRFAREYPATNRGFGARLIEMGRLDEEQTGPAIPIMLVTVAMVLVLACANVANLLLARGVSRHRELAVRAAMGASRMRIGRQLLIEAMLLALAGGAAGSLLAMLVLSGLRASLPDLLLTTQPYVEEIGVDGTTFGYTLIISILTAAVFGLLPAWRASHEQLQDGLRESASTGGSLGTRRLRTGLVVAEVTLSTLLLIGAGLLVRSYSGVQRVNPGFDPAGVLTMTMTLPEEKYPETYQRLQFYDEAIDRLERLSGVRSAGFVNVLPFSTYDGGTRLTVDGAPMPEPGREPSASYRIASPDYHATMRIPLVEGRLFDDRDNAEGQPVALVNQTLARRYLGGPSAVGRRVRLGSAADAPWLTIVGVIGSVHHSALTDSPDPEVYVPMAQAPQAMMMLAIRSDTRPEDLSRTVRAEIQAIDPAQPVYHVKTLEALVDESMLVRSTSAAVMTLFSALALVLAAVGIYGVVAYGVSQQRREFGVRLALGATPRDLLRLVFRNGMLMVGAGMVFGVAGALSLSRLMATALFGVSPADPLTYSSVLGLIAVTSLIACGVPAWRASTTQPAGALRSD
ncbi:MAG TPA: ABC transporter permease [Vicinamibacterales bacterium]|nr:ABC transporter permease [Vicinamibacterales bacterium]